MQFRVSSLAKGGTLHNWSVHFNGSWVVRYRVEGVSAVSPSRDNRSRDVPDGDLISLGSSKLSRERHRHLYRIHRQVVLANLAT
jgi:hypothetical protein